MRRRASPPLTADLAARIKRIALDHVTLAQHEIAALVGVNQGRISEVLTGKRYPNVPPARPA